MKKEVKWVCSERGGSKKIGVDRREMVEVVEVEDVWGSKVEM